MLIVALLFIILGIVVKYGKMYFLIAGYNTMSAEKKSKYDIDKIATVFRNVFFTMAVIIILGYFAANFFKDPDIENIAFYLALLTGIPYLLICINSKKYKINRPEREQKEE